MVAVQMDNLAPQEVARGLHYAITRFSEAPDDGPILKELSSAISALV